MFLYKYEIARHVYFKKNAYARFQEVRSLIDRLFQHIIYKKEIPLPDLYLGVDKNSELLLFS